MNPKTSGTIFGVPLAALVLDQATKHWANQFDGPGQLGPFEFLLYHNHGFMLGSLSDASPFFTVVVPATMGAFLIFLYFVLQYFLPIQSLLFRGSIGLFLGGILGNIVDRVRTSYVTDFLILKTPWLTSGIFNVGDALQWVGVGLFFWSFVGHGAVFYPVDQRRGRLWIDPPFQLRYCATLVALGAGFALISGMLSYTFLKVSLSTSAGDSSRILQAYVLTFAVATVAFLIILFLIGVRLSHRIVGPVQSFERFLEGLLEGRTRQFTLRQKDEFRGFEEIAGRFNGLFHEKLGLPPAPLVAGGDAPGFDARTLDGEAFDSASLAGRKVWLIFYRFVGCPVCSLHLKEALSTIRAVVARGVVVMAVYESPEAEFTEPSAANAMTMLRESGARVVPDPERRLFKLYRARSNSWMAFHPWSLWHVARALALGFRQGPIRGRLGRLPAHVLVNEQGQIADVHYSTTLFDHMSLGRIEKFSKI